MYQSQTKTTGTGVATTLKSMVSTQVGTSNVTFSGTEDLGGGLKALFLYEMDFDTTVSGTGPTAGGQIYAGVEGGFGTLKMGVPNTPSLTTQSGRSGFTSKIGGGRAGVMGLSGASRTRNSDSFHYATPTVGGFSAAVAYVPEASVNTAAIVDVGLFYANGPVGAGVSNYKQSALGTGTLSDHTTAFVSYTLGAAKIMVGAHTQTLVAAKTAGSNIALNYAITPVATLIANVAKTNDKTTADANLSMYALGVNYALSKRTQVTARFINEKKDNQTTTSVNSAKTTLVGIQHNF